MSSACIARRRIAISCTAAWMPSSRHLQPNRLTEACTVCRARIADCVSRDHQPLALKCEACLHGLERSHCSTTIRLDIGAEVRSPSVRAWLDWTVLLAVGLMDSLHRSSVVHPRQERRINENNARYGGMNDADVNQSARTSRTLATR